MRFSRTPLCLTILSFVLSSCAPIATVRTHDLKVGAEVRRNAKHSDRDALLVAALELQKREPLQALANLVRVEKVARAEVRITSKVADHFAQDFNVKPLTGLLNTADRIRGLLATVT